MNELIPASYHLALKNQATMLGAERKPMLGLIMMVILCITTYVPTAIGISFVLFVICYIALRDAAKRHPRAVEVYLENMKYAPFYPAVGKFADEEPWLDAAIEGGDTTMHTSSFNPISAFTVKTNNRPFSTLTNWSHYRDFDNGVIECKDGSLMVAWTYTGIDYMSADANDLNYVSDRLNDMVLSLGSGWVIWYEALRMETEDYMDPSSSHFPDPVSEMVDNERRKAVQMQDDHYVAVPYVVLMHTPESKTRSKIREHIMDDSAREQISDDQRELNDFLAVAEHFGGALGSEFFTRRLTPYNDGGTTFCDFARLLNYCATGELRPVAIGDPHIPLDMYIGQQEFLSSSRPQVGSNFVGVVTIESSKPETLPAMFAEMDSLPAEYRWSTRYICSDIVKSIEGMERHRKRWKGKEKNIADVARQSTEPRIDDHAVEMSADINEAQKELRSGEVSQGLYTSQFVVYSSDLDELNRLLIVFKKFVDNMGYGGRVENIATTSAFLGSIPGNVKANVMKTPITSKNLAHFMPVATEWAGKPFCPSPKFPDFSPPLIKAETPNSTPYNLNLHVDDVANTLMIGPTGSGKTTALSFISMQWLRYKDAQVFAFDYGSSMYVTAMGVQGNFYDLGGDQVSLMPLAHLDTEMDFAWTSTYVEDCAVLQNVVMTPEKRSELNNALERLKNVKSRTFTAFHAMLQDNELREAMKYYTLEGQAGHLTDGETETTEFNHFNVFEMKELMGMGDKVWLPVFNYLFRRIEKSLTGHPVLISMDEIWTLFGHDLTKEKIKRGLKTYRNLNGALLMATQSMADATTSGILADILDSTSSKILLPSSQISSEANYDFYSKQLGLNDREIQLLIRGVRKKQYYHRSDDGRRLFELNLKPKTLAFVGRSGPENIEAAKALSKEYPDHAEWVEKWLEHCGAA